MSEELGISVKKENLSEWYQEVVLKAELADYSPVKGCIVFRPSGYGIWEIIMREFDKILKEHGVQNAYFPLFIPETLLKREAEHFEGFVPEVAWVTMAGDEKLEERLAVRPTSETIMYSMFSKWLKSYKQLPMRINQWCNVVRWETKMTKPFLRGREFLWHEAHTVHETEKEAEEEVMWAINTYKKFVEEYLAIPVIAGYKTESEKFAGAVFTTTIESLMPDGRALQMGTAHMLGQNFSKPFDVKFLGRDEKWHYAWQTSWGISTRLLGAVILVHGDDKGAVIPPKIAPVQVVIIPITFKGKEKVVLEECRKVERELKERGVRVMLDDRPDYTPGWKFNDWELKGVPLRIELGPRDIEKGTAVIARRDTGEKVEVRRSELIEKVREELEAMQRRLFERAKAEMGRRTKRAEKLEKLRKEIERGNWVIAEYCGNEKCEEKIKEVCGAEPRVIPFGTRAKGRCVVCGKRAKYVVYWARAY